jgi:hypothetical protein
MLPTFVIIGAMRSGTTTLARALGEHPQVYMAPAKEIHYFDRHFSRGLGWYEQHFAGADGRTAVGEATPAYLFEDVVPPRMVGTLPDARLIAILRDPVERAYSHYWLERGLGREPLGFREALEAEPARMSADGASPRINQAYLGCSTYLPQLRRFCEHYPRQALLVLVLEDFAQDPGRTYGAVCRFLGLEEGFVPLEVGEQLNAYREYRSLWLRRAMRGGPRTPLRRLLARLNERRGSGYPPMDHHIRRELQERFAEHNAELAAWLGKDLSVWNR